MKLLSWDGNNINDGTNYDAVLNANFNGLPGIRAVLGARHGNWPILAGVERPYRQLNFDIYIRSGIKLELAQWFDPEDETAKQLIVEDSAGTNDRFVNAICTEFREVPYSAGLQYAVTVMVDGDVRWRKTPIREYTAWSITASGDTKVYANDGQDQALPILNIEPTGARSSGGFAYKVFCPVKWNEVNAATNYPTDIVDDSFDTATLTTAKMQADGDDLRVYVDGVEVDRWLQNMDTATTQVWCNLDFQGMGALRDIVGAHDSSQTTIYIQAYWDISDWPSSGIMLIDSELITYTGKNNQQRRLTGCTRGAKGTTAASHTTSTPIYWIQHDIWIYYGDSTVAAPTVDDDDKPIFLLSSTNASWVYNRFGENNIARTARWIKNTIYDPIIFYTDDDGGYATPWAEIGLVNAIGAGEWKLTNPCGISNANFQNGEQKCTFKTALQAFIYSNNGAEYTIPDPTNNNTWDTWSRDEAISPVSDWVSLRLYPSELSMYTSWVEVADVTLTISNPPTIAIGSEQSNYTLSCTITNNTTGDAIEVNFDMALNEELEIDTDEKTVIYLEENSNQYNGLDLVGGVRRFWLPLAPGNNTLQFDDIGTGNVTINLSWWVRLYE